MLHELRRNTYLSGAPVQSKRIVSDLKYFESMPAALTSNSPDYIRGIFRVDELHQINASGIDI
jgi:hypothetical protein